jgi:hypothetical protein
MAEWALVTGGGGGIGEAVCERDKSEEGRARAESAASGGWGGHARAPWGREPRSSRLGGVGAIVRAS